MPKKVEFTKKHPEGQDAELRAWLQPKDDDDLIDLLWFYAYIVDPKMGAPGWGADPHDALIEYGVEKYGVRR